MNDTYQANLEYLKEIRSPLVEGLLEPDVSGYRLVEQDNGETNVVNTKSGVLLYPPNVSETIDIQLAKWAKFPARIVFPPCEANQEHNELSSRYTNQLHSISPLTLGTQKPSDLPLWDNANVPYLMVLGFGIGHHIIKLIERYDIRQMVVVDETIQTLRLAMHLHDWRPVEEYFRRPGRNIHYVLRADPRQGADDLIAFTRERANILAINGFVYRHSSSNILDETNKYCAKFFRLLSQGWGFYTDEVTSLQQSLYNVRKRIPVFRPKRVLYDKATAVLAANGPSLDNAIPWIKKHRKKIVLFSCGTAIRTLYKQGIRPDIHVEIERILEAYHSVRDSAPRKWLQNIPMLAPTRVHPALFTATDRPYTYQKHTDTGGLLVGTIVDGIPFCNPTVANGAFAMALTAGFGRIILQGMDLGWKDPKLHHSKDSLYMMATHPLFKAESLSEVTGVCVDGSEMQTSNILELSRHNLELILMHYGHVDVINCSGGVHIDGTKAMPMDQVVPDSKPQDSAAALKGFLDCFKVEHIPYRNFPEVFAELHRDMASLVEGMRGIMEVGAKDRHEFFDRLGDIDVLFRPLQQTNPILSRMLWGSMIQLGARLHSHEVYIEDSIDFVNTGLKIFHEFLEAVQWDLIMRLGDSTSDALPLVAANTSSSPPPSDSATTSTASASD